MKRPTPYTADQLPAALLEPLRAFQDHYGDRWPHVLTLYHMGRPAAAPDGGHEDLIGPMRQLRNNLTADADLIPDLRTEKAKPRDRAPGDNPLDLTNHEADRMRAAGRKAN
jgi:hypothetical protein